jgi:HK97 family phage major capsid protein
MSQTATPPVNPEAAAKQFLQELKDLHTTGFPQAVKDLSELKEKWKSIDGLDFKALMYNVDKVSAGYDRIREQIRTFKGGLYVPGLEEEGKKFSILRAMIATKTGDWSNAGFEKEVFEQTKKVREKAGHVIGVDSQGGNFVPDQVIPDVITAIYTASVFIALAGTGQTNVSVLDGLTGIPVKMPKFDGGTLGYWIGEQDDYVQSFVRTGNISLQPRKLGVLTRITDEMRRFQSYGYENLLRNDMIRAAAKTLDYAVPYGTGTENMPKGIVRYSDIKVWCAEQASTTFDSDDSGAELSFDQMLEMQGALEDDNIVTNGTAKWISHPRFFRRRKQDKVQMYSGQTDQMQYLLGAPFFTDAELSSMIGPYATSTQFPTTNLPGASYNKSTTSTTAKFGDVMYGNWSEVLLARWSGIEIVDDSGLGQGFINDQTYMKMRMYCDVGVRQERALIVCPDAKMKT